MEGHRVVAGTRVIARDRMAAVTFWLEEGAEAEALGPVENGKYGYRFPATTPRGLCHIDPSKVDEVTSE